MIRDITLNYCGNNWSAVGLKCIYNLGPRFPVDYLQLPPYIRLTYLFLTNYIEKVEHFTRLVLSFLFYDANKRFFTIILKFMSTIQMYSCIAFYTIQDKNYSISNFGRNSEYYFCWCRLANFDTDLPNKSNNILLVNSNYINTQPKSNSTNINTIGYHT